MGKMGIGYGSEYQLLRYLGRHRKFLDKIILDTLGKQDENIEWLDFEFSKTNSSNSDNELKGIQPFLLNGDEFNIEDKWKTFWPTSGSAQSWDAVFKINDEWYLVEAKAHLNELVDPHKKLDKDSAQKILKAFEETKSFLDINENIDWMKSKYYQLCNRLAFEYFCIKNNIKAKIVYIDFINGYKKNNRFIGDNASSKEEWENCFKEVYKTIGIMNSSILDKYLVHVYIDCEQGKKKDNSFN